MKRVALGIALILFAFPAKGAPTKAKKPKVQEEKNTASFKVSTGVPHNTAEFTEHLQEIDRNLQSLSAHFEQSLAMPEAGISQKAEGSLEYLKPNHFRFEQTQPERQTVVSDGDKIWVYRVSQNQVIESSMADWKKSDPLLNNLMDFGNYSKLIANYEISYDSATLQAVLRPKEKTGEPFALKLKLSGKYLFPLETDLDVGQTKIQTVLSRVRFNPVIPESRFRFTPPKGAEVFDHFKPPTTADPSHP